MKQLLLAVILFFTFSLTAQEFRWSQGASASEIRYYRSATDKHGNCYVTGYFIGTVNFNGTIMTSYGSQDIFLAKYDTTGALLWVVQGGSPAYDQGYGVCVDSADNCYMVGTFSGTCNFGNGKVMYSLGNTDAFLAKYNKNGSCQWVNRFGSNTAEAAYGVDCSPNGTVYVTGYFTGFCAFLSQPTNNLYLTAIGNYEIFLAKYNNNGVCSWVRSAGGGGYDYGYDVTVDDSANAYMVGWFQGGANFGSIYLGASSTWYNGFVAKYDKFGNAKWAIHCPSGSQYGYAYAIGGDGYGNLFICGYYYGTATFGPFTITANSSSFGWAYGSYIAKLNTNGVYEWAKNIQSGGLSYAYSYDVTGNASGACFVTGAIYNWWGWGNTGMPTICSTPFPNNNTNSWGYHCFGVKFKPNGDCGWSVRGSSQYNGSPGSSYAYGYGISVNDFGSIYISGYNTSNLKFYLNADSVTSYGNVLGVNWGSFLAHFKDDNFILIGHTQRTYCPGDSFWVPFKAYGVYGSNNYFKAQLSDSNGGFQNFQYVGTRYTSNLEDSILIYLPATLGNGKGYRIRVEASNPLTRSNKSLNDIIIERPVADIFNDNDTLCLGDSVQLFADDAFKYRYYSNFHINDSTRQNVWVKPPATTTVYLRTENQAGCENFDSIHIVIVPRPVPDAGRDTSVCIGDSLQLHATGGTVYRWYPATGLSDTGIANPKVLLDANRTYYVEVGNGFCTETDSIVLTRRQPLKLLQFADTTICIGQTAILHAAPSGGYAPGYQLQWDHGLPVGNYVLVNPVVTTTYKVRLTDGCTTQPDSAFITVFVRPRLKVTVRTDTTICNGQSVLLYAMGAGGDSLNHSFYWNNGAGNGKQIWVSPSVTTTYKVVLKDNCTTLSDSALVTITVRPPLNVIANADTTICIGQSAAVRVTNISGGDVAGYKYAWYNATTQALIATTSITTVNPTVTTSYYVVVTDNCTSKSDTDDITVFVRPPLFVEAMNDTTICYGATTTLKVKTATGGNVLMHAFNWYDATNTLIGTGAQITSPPVFGSASYYVIISDGCTSLNDTDYVTLSTLTPLRILARKDSIICIGQTTQLYAWATGGDSINYQFRWLDSATNAFIGNGNYFSVTPSKTTTYRVVLSDNCSPRTDTDYVKISHRPALQIKFPHDTTICRGQSVKLFVDGSGGDSTGYEFRWDNGLGSGQSQTVTPLSTRTYKVILKDYCTLKSDSAFITITVRDPLNVNAGTDKGICYGQSTTLSPAFTIGGYPAGYQYQWINLSTGVTEGNTRTISVSPLSTTTYRLVLSDNCTVINDSDEVKVNVNPSLIIKINSGPLYICRGTKVTLQSNAGGGYDPAKYKFLWNRNLGTTNNITFFPDSTAYYKITLSDDCSTPVSDSVLITVEQLPQPDFIADITSGCNPVTTQFTNTSVYVPGSRFYWDFGDGLTDTVFSPKHTYLNPGDYPVSLKIISPKGCENSIEKKNYISSHPIPKAVLKAAPVRVKISSGKIYFTDASTFSDSVEWYFGDGQHFDFSTSHQVLHQYTDTGIFIVTLYVRSKYGCEATVSDTVFVDEDFNYFLPNVFSPNNDGKNEVFRPSITYAKYYKLTIYNRWGELMYAETIHGSDRVSGWDGTFRGAPAPDGVYIYQLYILDRSDKETNKQGTFLLTR